MDHGLISARDVTRQFRIGRRQIDVLRGVSLEIQRGEKVFLCGPSGAGKTTLMYTLAGLERPTSGEVLINGKSLYRGGRKEISRTRNQMMGYVFQNFLLMPELSALENVLLPAFIGRDDRLEQAKDILERVGMGHRLHHLPSELSGGEQQRVAIARALVNEPAILFADEPTGNLDSKAGAEVMELLTHLVSEKGTTLVVVTHDEGLTHLGDRVLHLVDGQISADAAPTAGVL
ncbi:ABC transporter ATP-binding protein [Sulfuriroseicoccus oceanibius]|uniref:ABC transporter ATP-binding protein n=1 Tax=Sulfuriroseicoccus oceanibius TaxID=2707525 RepID=A0A6B3LD77_9BACT|nr:ABC transporter ATP-binding protein [Sulfuriroseicoccus oceanibius]QQL44898.1 ABC transporter ATP-binding protein [Sulfuriroseicoccus oceanibius]